MVVIIITGSPATGKSTLTENLYAYFTSNSLHNSLRYGESDSWKKYDLKKMIEKDKLYDAVENDGTMVVDEKKLIKSLITNLEKDSGKNIIIDSFFSHYLPSQIVDLCIVCSCDISILNQRLSNRAYTMEKIRENLDCEILDVCGQEAIENNHDVVYFDSSKDDINVFMKKIDDVLFG